MNIDYIYIDKKPVSYDFDLGKGKVFFLMYDACSRGPVLFFMYQLTV